MKKDKIRKAWIQGNIISFEKPKYRSAFFGVEEVLVISIKKEDKELPKWVVKLLTNNKV